MIKTTIITSIELEVEVSADYVPGKNDYFDRSYGNYQPGDAPEVNKLKVTVSKSNRTIDITDVLSGKIKAELEEQISEEFQKNGVA